MTIDELGRRAVACRHWRWIPGMLSYGASRAHPTVVGRVRLTETHDAPTQLVDPWPDFVDAATLGCLLKLVRSAWPEEWHQFMVPIFGGMGHWYMGCMMHGRIIMPTRLRPNGLPDTIAPKPTEAEALVAALEAAP